MKISRLDGLKAERNMVLIKREITKEILDTSRTFHRKQVRTYCSSTYSGWKKIENGGQSTNRLSIYEKSLKLDH